MEEDLEDLMKSSEDEDNNEDEVVAKSSKLKVKTFRNYTNANLSFVASGLRHPFSLLLICGGQRSSENFLLDSSTV